ncbi:hypothetical protein V3O24_09995 [Methylobacter sp. Wu8]|uniref:hypothetical protein n=1 Tax=Methylobacter sp. Wu8 TaxID=3118457 RepID=UPI002F3349D7
MLNGKAAISDLVDLEITGLLRLVGGASGVALYMARTAAGISKISIANDMPYETTLMPIPNLEIGGVILDASSSSRPTIIVPQWLPSVPDWALANAADGGTAGAILAFGGAVNALLVGGAKEGTLDIPNILDQADYSHPRFVRGAAPASAMKACTTAVADGETLMLFPPATGNRPAKGVKLVPAVSGAVFQYAPGDTTLWAVYQEGGRQAAILSSHGVALGSVKLVSFDESLESVGYIVPIVDEPIVAEFDVDVRDGVYFLLATTDAAPQLMLFDDTGATEKLDWPVNGLGEGCRMTSPTVLAIPAASTLDNQAPAPAFLFAFIEMADKGPVGLRLGTITLAPADGHPPKG